MTNLQFWVNVCRDNDWIDLLDSFVSIVETSQGDNQRNALQAWSEEAAKRFDAMPPEESAVMAHNPSMQVASQFGTEI